MAGFLVAVNNDEVKHEEEFTATYGENYEVIFTIDDT
jgi:hypothetical protein